MKFQKLALATAIALAPAAGMAMTEMEDDFLSGVTGQDGIELDLTTSSALTADIYIHDTDGLGATPISAGYSFDGAIVIDNFSYSGSMGIDIDAGDNAQGPTGAPVLNINVNIPTATIITGDILVANSQRDDATVGWGINTTSGVLLNTMTIVMAGLTINMQLGNEPQGNMIAIDSTVTNGITINNFALSDANSGGSLGASQILIKDTGADANLRLRVNADANSSGLQVALAQVGSTTGMDIRITDAYLGNTGAGIIGDITIVGLDVDGVTLQLSGK